MTACGIATGRDNILKLELRREIEMTELLDSIREATTLPLWADLLALVFVALSPLVIKKWWKVVKVVNCVESKK
jgi:hypothetical protein